jgi:hypothetical protein
VAVTILIRSVSSTDQISETEMQKTHNTLTKLTSTALTIVKIRMHEIIALRGTQTVMLRSGGKHLAPKLHVEDAALAYALPWRLHKHA